MVTGPNPDPTAEALRRLRRRFRLYTYVLVAATAVVVIGGAALVAWLLRPAGLPFRETWLISGVLILMIPAVGLALQRVGGKTKEQRPAGADEPRAAPDETD